MLRIVVDLVVTRGNDKQFDGAQGQGGFTDARLAANALRECAQQVGDIRANLFFRVMILGEAAESRERLLTTLNAAALAVKDLRNAVTQLLGPVGILGLRVFIVERADTIE